MKLNASIKNIHNPLYMNKKLNKNIYRIFKSKMKHTIINEVLTAQMVVTK